MGGLMTLQVYSQNIYERINRVTGIYPWSILVTVWNTCSSENLLVVALTVKTKQRNILFKEIMPLDIRQYSFIYEKNLLCTSQKQQMLKHSHIIDIASGDSRRLIFLINFRWFRGFSENLGKFVSVKFVLWILLSAKINWREVFVVWCRKNNFIRIILLLNTSNYE